MSATKNAKKKSVSTPLHLLQQLSSSLLEHLEDACTRALVDAEKLLAKLEKQRGKAQEKLHKARSKMQDAAVAGKAKAQAKAKEAVAELEQLLDTLKDRQSETRTYIASLKRDAQESLKLAQGVGKVKEAVNKALDSRSVKAAAVKPAAKLAATKAPAKPAASKPAAKPATKAAAPAAKAPAKAPAKSAAKAPAKAASKAPVAAKPAAKAPAKPAAKKPAAASAAKPAASKPVAQPAKAAAKPAVKKAPAVKPASKPVAKPAAKPAAKTEPAKAPAAPAAAPAAEKAAPPSEAETTVRVDTARLDEIMNMVGELVLVRNRLVRLGASSGDEAMSKAVSNLDVVTADLQTAVMKTRMQPIKKVFGRFPRLVRDLARNLKKEINLELVGEETDLDKNLVEALADPLVHLVRNAVDHGIETPEEREASGKPRGGKVILSAEQEGDHILLSISDDGKGMDADQLRAKAVEKGLLDKDAADRLNEFECYNLIFAPGFSTKTEISDVSGRGVGMDVVKTKISQLNGTVNVFSVKGQGSKIVIKVPLTLAIMPTLMVMLANQAFAFPLVNVNEIFHLDLSRTNVVDGQEVVIVRDKALPLFYLKRWLIGSAAHVEQGEGHVVILTVGSQRIGFVVDQLVGQEEVVIKPLGKMLQGTPGMSGATITGDGRIALILDVPSMLKRYARRI